MYKGISLKNFQPATIKAIEYRERRTWDDLAFNKRSDIDLMLWRYYATRRML